MKRIISLMSLVLAAGGIGFEIYAWPWQHRPHVLEIYCFALDKTGASPGNLAVFIRTPDDHTILIDGGKSNSILPALSSAMPFYRRSIDTVISTDPDDSHVTGLVSVLQRYRVGQVMEIGNIGTTTNATSSVNSAYPEFEKEITDEKIKQAKVVAGDVIDFGDPALSVKVIFPAESTDFEYSKTNIPVLAFTIDFGSTELFFGGDMTKKEQNYLAIQGIVSSTTISLPQTLLILPHAENSDGADESFFTNLNPNFAVVLKNPAKPAKLAKSTKTKTTTKTSKPKKPAKPPFDVSAVAGLSIWNVTLDGDVEFISDGKSFLQKELK